MNLKEAQKQISEIKARQMALDEKDIDTWHQYQKQIRKLEQETILTPWDHVELARRPDRPKAQDYIELLFADFLVDCGLMAGEEDGGYPYLTQEEIKRADYVFLTHSHADHTGAIPWLVEKGFHGNVVASKETLEQLPFEVRNTMTISWL